MAVKDIVPASRVTSSSRPWRPSVPAAGELPQRPPAAGVGHHIVRASDISCTCRGPHRKRRPAESRPERGVVRGGDNAFMLLSSGEVQLALVTEQEIRLLREFGTRKLLLSPG